MKRVFGVKKNKEPPPSVGDASDRVCVLVISTVSSFSVAKIFKILAFGAVFRFFFLSISVIRDCVSFLFVFPFFWGFCDSTF